MKIIKKIEIKHFRSIFDQSIEELNHIVIFGGQNDSGKSNVLRALNLFFNGQTSFLEEFNFFDDFSMSSKVKARESKKGRQFISIKIYFDVNEIKGNKNELVKLINQNGDLWVERRWWAYTETYEQTEPDYIGTASQGIKRSFSVFLKSIKFVYIPAFKSTEVFSYILKLSARNKGLFLSTTAKDELDANIDKTTKDFSKDFQDITGVDTSVTLPISLESFWSSLEVNSQFEDTPETITRGSRDDYKIKFTSRGEGIKSLFVPVVLGWLARKAKDDHWIWGIDEPENALEALRADNLFVKFVEYSKAAQIFLSTHSPSFIFPQNNPEAYSIFISNQDKPGNTIFNKISESNNLEKVFGYNYGSFLEVQKNYSLSIKKLDEQTQELEDLKKLENSPIVFVEGPTDERVLKEAWKLLFPSISNPYVIKAKNNAQGVSYALENAEIFEKQFVLGLFDFDGEGFQRWNGLTNHDYTKKLNTIGTCLTLKKKKCNFYALLLPLSNNSKIKAQVINPATGDHFGGESRLEMEHLFYGVTSLEQFFEEKNTPGGGMKICPKGDTDLLINAAIKIGPSAFENFKPIFKTLEDFCADESNDEVQNNEN